MPNYFGPKFLCLFIRSFNHYRCV